MGFIGLIITMLIILRVDGRVTKTRNYILAFWGIWKICTKHSETRFYHTNSYQ